MGWTVGVLTAGGTTDGIVGMVGIDKGRAFIVFFMSVIALKSVGIAVNDENGPAGAMDVLGSKPMVEGATETVLVLLVGMPASAKA